MKWCNLFILVGLPLFLNAQINTTQLLSFEEDKDKTTLSQQYLSDLSSISYKIPIVEKLEFRTEVERLVDFRQDFLFRSSFNGLSHRKAQLSKHKQYIERQRANIAVEDYNKLEKRYREILDILELQIEINGTSAQFNYQAKMDSLYQMMLSVGEPINLKNYIQNKEEWILTNLELIKKKSLLHSEMNRLAKTNDTTISLIGIVTPENMKKWIDELDFDILARPEISRNETMDLYLDAEYNTIHAKDNKIIDFAQVRYNVREDLLFENRISVGVGLLIPWSGSSKLKYRDIEIDRLKNMHEKQELISALQLDFIDSRQKFYHLFDVYQMYKKHEDDPVWKDMKRRISMSGRMSISDQLSIEKYELEKTKTIDKMYIDLLRSFIEVVANSGKLALKKDYFLGL
ncbi:MAG: hypothetical protein WAT79_04290 [Saprospiraceae bacterium]